MAESADVTGLLPVAGAVAVLLAVGALVISALRHARYVADHDELTGLLGRRAVLRRVSAALKKRQRDGGRMAVLAVDLDGFSRINDSFSHQVGDSVLEVVADVLQGVAAPGDSVGRLGGDEFLLVRPRVKRHPEEWADSVRQALADRMDIGGTPLRLTASVGLVVADRSVGDSARLLRDVDLALQEAKRAGADRVCLFSPELRAYEGRRYQRVAEAMQAVEARQLETWYQPVIDLHTERIVGAEALVRWQHPERGVLKPEEFLPELEAAGFMPSLTTRVLEQSCAAFATGLPAEQEWLLTVNLSRGELSSNVVDSVLGALETYGLPAHRLRLEVDERTVPDAPVVEILRRLVDAGVPIIIDDFGTGWSSFGQLLRILPSSVKLDRELVASVAASENSLRRGGQRYDFPGSRRDTGWTAAQERAEAVDLIGAFCTLAARLDMAVVAEGIETVQQRDLVRRLGCTLGQGHFYAPAMPFDGFLRWARSYMEYVEYARASTAARPPRHLSTAPVRASF